jgi:hypothetical protein
VKSDAIPRHRVFARSGGHRRIWRL